VLLSQILQGSIPRLERDALRDEGDEFLEGGGEEGTVQRRWRMRLCCSVRRGEEVQ
jgi:hypothetical protein